MKEPNIGKDPISYIIGGFLMLIILMIKTIWIKK